jgi:hypothetical protein
MLANEATQTWCGSGRGSKRNRGNRGYRAGPIWNRARTRLGGLWDISNRDFPLDFIKYTSNRLMVPIINCF